MRAPATEGLFTRGNWREISLRQAATNFFSLSSMMRAFAWNERRMPSSSLLYGEPAAAPLSTMKSKSASRSARSALYLPACAMYSDAASSTDFARTGSPSVESIASIIFSSVKRLGSSDGTFPRMPLSALKNPERRSILSFALSRETASLDAFSSSLVRSSSALNLIPRAGMSILSRADDERAISFLISIGLICGTTERSRFWPVWSSSC